MTKFSKSLASATLIWILLAAPLLRAAELGGVSLPDSVELNGQPRVLNGLGLRLATMFKVKVYVAGLYVAEKSPDAAKLLADTQSKLVRMSMLRNLDAEQLNEAFSEGFQKACRAEECKTFEASVKSFVNLLPQMKTGEVLDFELLPEALLVKKGGQTLGTVVHPGLAQVILRIWIGEFPPNPELKSGMLGTKQ